MTDEQLLAQLQDLPAGTILRFARDGHLFTFIPTTSLGIHTGRRRYCVVCSSCERLLHEETTGPIHLMNAHLKEPSSR